MIKYFKVVESGYISTIGKTKNSIPQNAEINAEEYNAINAIVLTRPVPPSGFGYNLRADTLEWELVELLEPESTSEDDELSAEEALAIITGGASDD